MHFMAAAFSYVLLFGTVPFLCWCLDTYISDDLGDVEA